MKLLRNIRDVVELAANKAISVDTAVSQLYVICILNKFSNHIKKEKSMSSENNSLYIKMHNKILAHLDGNDFADIDGERILLSQISDALVNPASGDDESIAENKSNKCKSFSELLKELPWRLDY